LEIIPGRLGMWEDMNERNEMVSTVYQNATDCQKPKEAAIAVSAAQEAVQYRIHVREGRGDTLARVERWRETPRKRMDLKRTGKPYSLSKEIDGICGGLEVLPITRTQSFSSPEELPRIHGGSRCAVKTRDLACSPKHSRRCSLLFECFAIEWFAGNARRIHAGSACLNTGRSSLHLSTHPSG
jgi:hypothetical protein